jgi:hypothetical protein
MTLEEAMSELINSSEFNEIAKEKEGKGSKYRVMRLRYNRGELKAIAMTELLIHHGYIISVSRPKKQKNS